MIKQLPSKNLTNFIKDNPKSVLLDVRTKEEWDQIGKPDGDKIGIKTYFLSSLFQGRLPNENFEEEFNKLGIDKDSNVLVMCGTMQKKTQCLVRIHHKTQLKISLLKNHHRVLHLNLIN